MKVHQLDKAQLINETQLGDRLNQSVSCGYRADFSLLLAMLSPDIREHEPLDIHQDSLHCDAVLREQLELPAPQALHADDSSYERGALEANAFHRGGLNAAHLQHYTSPSALTHLPQDTHGFPEQVYHNLSGHQRRRLEINSPQTPSLRPQRLLNALTLSKRANELQLTA
ncbi:VC2046/SO_2500 family protein [Thaumasiovibrio sp. DFM-14]|uniref:VC2046/SO_2500 family protein n=1 Tax=Thaumasiovibrio sp. DFM-14 TaxID=3384792 RepID=UPI0039A182BD